MVLCPYFDYTFTRTNIQPVDILPFPYSGSRDRYFNHAAKSYTLSRHLLTH